MTELKDRYRQQRIPAALAAELEHEFARRAQPWRWPGRAAVAAAVVLAAAVSWIGAGQWQIDADPQRYAALDESPAALSPAALTARTSEFGQLSVSRLSLPSNTNLAGVTSMPVLPPAPPPPATL